MKKQLLLFVILLLPTVAMADDSGECGNNVTWTYVEATHTLTISGEGGMWDYTYPDVYDQGTQWETTCYHYPWSSFRKVIERVIIDEGVTYIGDFSFIDLENLQSVKMSSSMTNIGSCAFSGCSRLISIDIPNSVMSIGSSAFFGCSSLTSIDIPNSVMSIGSSAFFGCSNLVSAAIGSGVVSIEGSILGECSQLATITVDSNNTTFDSRENCNAIINTSTNELVVGIKTTVIPNSVTAIGASAFSDCIGLTSMTIPNSVTSIGEGAFAGCSGLTSITIPNNITNIERSTFSGCSTLASILIPNSVTSIGEWAFSGCVSLPSITIPNSVTSIGYDAFAYCSALNSVHISDLEAWCKIFFHRDNNYYEDQGYITSNPLYYAHHLFLNGEEIKELVIPNTVTSINNWAFSGCSGLTSVTIPSNVTNVHYSSFSGCNNLTAVYISDLGAWCNIQFNGPESNPLNYAHHLFLNGEEIKELVIPNNVKTISGYAFYGCTGLTSVTIPASVMTIQHCAFSDCNNITKVVIEDGDKKIIIDQGYDGYSFFRSGYYHYIYPMFYQSPVQELYIGRNLICSSPLVGSQIKSVEIGSFVDEFPQYSFYNVCTEEVNYKGTLEQWCNISFTDETATPFNSGNNIVLNIQGAPLPTQVVIPEGATKVGAYSFYGQNMSTIFIPESMKTIERYAFNNYNITEICINATDVISLEDANAFNENTIIYVPNVALDDYRTADVWSTLADKIFPMGFYDLTVDLIAKEDAPALFSALKTLEDTGEEYNIGKLTNLKINGSINGWDILMIRTKMPNLRVLDLSEASILDNDGGKEYYTGCHTTANTISPYSFYQLSNLRKVILPQNITSIGNNAFNGCSNLREVLNIPQTCTIIEYRAFANSGLNQIEIPGSVKTINSYAFYNSNLKELTLGKGVETIEYNAFQNCSNLKRLVLPTTLKLIGGEAFENCYQLNEIDFAEGQLTDIEYSAFQNCNNLRDLHLPTTLKRIGGSAFRYCYNLSEVHVPSMMESIGDYAFKNCGLKSVYAYTIAPIQINQNTFDYNGVKLYAPDNSFYAYYFDTQWSQFRDVTEFAADYSQWYTPRNWDVEIDLSKPIKSSTGAIGMMYSGSGMLFYGDGEQQVKELQMNWQHGSNYPSVIENGHLSVDELKFIMNVYPYRWYFFSFPFDINIADIAYEGKWVWRYYDGEERANNGSGGWKNVTDGVLRANVGYIFQCNTEGDLTLPIENPNFSAYTTGSNTQDKEVALQSYESKNAQDASWNFVGNPNLSYYGLEDLGDFNAPVTVWDNENQTYTAVMPGDDDYDFHPFEAFFVQTPTNSAEISFEGDKRATYVQTEKKQANRVARRAARRMNENRLLMNLILSDGTTSDRTRIIFNDENKMDYEVGTDANKFISTAAVPQIYTLDGKNVKYAINARPNGNQEVRIGYVATAEGEYTISSDLLDCYMALKDYETGTIHMLDDGAYEFQTEKGTFDSRFALIPAGSVTGISSKGIEGFDIVAVDGGIAVNGILGETVNIYKANGVKVATLKDSGKASLASGTYIVTIAGKSTKVQVK